MRVNSQVSWSREHDLLISKSSALLGPLVSAKSSARGSTNTAPWAVWPNYDNLRHMPAQWARSQQRHLQEVSGHWQYLSVCSRFIGIMYCSISFVLGKEWWAWQRCLIPPNCWIKRRLADKWELLGKLHYEEGVINLCSLIVKRGRYWLVHDNTFSARINRGAMLHLNSPSVMTLRPLFLSRFG